MLVASGRLTLISGWRLQNDKNQSSQAICVFCEKGCWSLFCSAMRRTSLGVSPNSSLCISFMCFTSISSKSGLRTGHRPGRGLWTLPRKCLWSVGLDFQIPLMLHLVFLLYTARQWVAVIGNYVRTKVYKSNNILPQVWPEVYMFADLHFIYQQHTTVLRQRTVFQFLSQ